MNYIRTTILSAFILLGISLFAHAQILPDPVSIQLDPVSPSPGETVTITANTPTFDRNTTLFEWSIDGKTQSDISGYGKNEITITAGDLGSATRVTVNVSPRNKPSLALSTTVRVSDLALTWFADTYIPKWYKGKALPSQGSTVTVIAIPDISVDGRLIRQENLLYSWTLDDQEDILKGVGESIFKLQMADLSHASHVIKVTIQDIDKKIEKKGILRLKSYTPEITLYPVSPLGGTEFRTALESFATQKRGLFDFTAEPFFFNTLSKRDLLFQWFTGGQPIEGNPQNPTILTIDTGDSQQGDTTLNIQINNPSNNVHPSVSKTINFSLQ